MKFNSTKTLITVVISVTLLVIVASCIWIGYTYKRSAQNNSTQKTATDTKGLFTLTSTYKGNSQWTYKVEAQLPNPCVKAMVDARVAESYPERVTVQVITSNTSEVCVQMIQDFNFDGTFSASEKAVVRLSVND